MQPFRLSRRASGKRARSCQSVTRRPPMTPRLFRSGARPGPHDQLIIPPGTKRYATETGKHAPLVTTLIIAVFRDCHRPFFGSGSDADVSTLWRNSFTCRGRFTNASHEVRTWKNAFRSPSGVEMSRNAPLTGLELEDAWTLSRCRK
ncbi:hypothetical protein BDFB_003581 [Asbolus verrucosus]|uniref:Uncharacterized protein n=1 Tax=Asbolus verrucosus TaxID=1661398 RepID=A0A482VCC4_ASBVE|nr:hypothetical protein BDFB_003581 [Asbolus verrucosus]